MRTYFVFDIKDEFNDLYNDNQELLFLTFNQLFHSNAKNDFGINIFCQLTRKLDSYKLNKDIFVKYHKELIYTKVGNEHIINNLYKDEISVLTIKGSYMLINSNSNYSSFFNILLDYSNNYFVIDFKNKDYFFLNNVKTLV